MIHLLTFFGGHQSRCRGLALRRQQFASSLVRASAAFWCAFALLRILGNLGDKGGGREVAPVLHGVFRRGILLCWRS
jgi:hypothetical protein